ncbi:MAG: glutamine--fructose-6-phosphate aminotransferase, partial [Clostridia bacterium]|nr:glutamine--fructose-6-phosphate aminotransferase [Clostridia bacterium]
MCNIAGYVGDRPAAPILIEMIRRQQGLDGGYYTGIATIHQGRLHYAKLAGDLDHLLENSEAMNLPGNIGIIHSRTRSGGGDGWA